MSAADRQRSWRSAPQDGGPAVADPRLASGGPKARKKDAGLTRKMQTRSEVSSRDREAISPHARGIGPQSRAISREWGAKAEKRAQSAKAVKTELIGGGHATARAAVQHGIQATQPGQASGGTHGEI